MCYCTRCFRWDRNIIPYLCSVSKPLVLPWDLSMVLNALSKAPFKPIDNSALKLLVLKTVLLLTLTTMKRVSEIHALSVHPSCMMFAPGGQKVTFRSTTFFISRGMRGYTVYFWFVFCVHMYRGHAHFVRETSCLSLVGWLLQGKNISGQRLSHWMVVAIMLCYNNANIESPGGLQAHSTRDMATLWALFKGIYVQEICAGASWSSLHTFVRFCILDVTEPSLTHSVLGVSSHIVQRLLGQFLLRGEFLMLFCFHLCLEQ